MFSILTDAQEVGKTVPKFIFTVNLLLKSEAQEDNRGEQYEWLWGNIETFPTLPSYSRQFPVLCLWPDCQLCEGGDNDF